MAVNVVYKGLCFLLGRYPRLTLDRSIYREPPPRMLFLTKLCVRHFRELREKYFFLFWKREKLLYLTHEFQNVTNFNAKILFVNGCIIILIDTRNCFGGGKGDGP